MKTQTPLERLIDLLIIHEGACSIVADSDLHAEAIKLSESGNLRLTASVSNMVELHFVAKECATPIKQQLRIWKVLLLNRT